VADTKFEIGIGVQGQAGVESAGLSLNTLADRLTEAGAASESASAALRAGEEAYARTEATAAKAALALERVTLKVEENRAKMEKAMAAGDEQGFARASAAAEKFAARQAEASAKADQAKAAMNAQATALDRLRTAAATAAEGQGKLAAQLDVAKKAADAKAKIDAAAAAAAKGSGKANEAAEALGKLGGPLGRLGAQAFGAKEAMQKLFAAFGTGAGPYIAAAVAIVAISTAAAAATIAMTAWAISTSDAARSAQLLSDGIAGSAEGGRILDGIIDDLTTRVPQGREELEKLAAPLIASGLKGADLAEALEDVATKAAKTKWGPDFIKQTIALPNLVARLKDNLTGKGGLFGGLKLEELLGNLSKAVGLFDKSSVTGEAMRVVFTDIFQPIIDSAAAMVPKAVSAFIQLEILVLKAGIAIKPYGSKIVMLGETFAVMAGIVIGVVALAFGILAAAFLFTVARLRLVYEGVMYMGEVFLGVGNTIVAFSSAAVAGVSAAFDFVRLHVGAAIDFLRGLSLADIGTALIDGLIAGIKAAGAGVLGAVTGVVGGAIDGAKSLLGIASPSKVFELIGSNTAEGMAVGLDSGAATVQGAIEGVVAPPALEAVTLPGATAPSPTATAPTSGQGGAVNLSGATFVFNGVQGAEDAEGRFGALLTRLLEGDVAQLGSAVPT
jgi:hypothetical protein